MRQKRKEKEYSEKDFQEYALNIHVDGSCNPNPGSGGIGIRYSWFEYDENGLPIGDEPKVYPFPQVGYMNVTNQIMELHAAFIALKEVLSGQFDDISNKIIVWTDSSYVVDNYPRSKYWKNNGWRNRDGKPIDNQTQWEDLIKVTYDLYKKKGMKVEFKWVKGHKDSKGNIEADRMAKESATISKDTSLSHSTERRKPFKDSKTVKGSVKMKGQVLIIQILGSRFISKGTQYLYRYVVHSMDSPYYKNMDKIYYDPILLENHYYEVRFNENQGYPQILEVLREVDKSEIIKPAGE
ncbi:MAG: hypothetical protein HPY53_01620 [Brevinematales bacterium]|nr:hypothetical protein [Brevinematales bacterium]